jgi:hypothetical protein
MSAVRVADDHWSLSSLTIAWLSNKWLVLLTTAIIPITYFDVVATLYNIAAYGLEGEANPFVRWFYLNNLTWLWFIITGAVSTLVFVVLGSIHANALDEDKPLLSGVYAFVWTIRLTATLYGAGKSFWLLEDPRFILLVAIPAVVGVWLILTHQESLSWHAFKGWFGGVREAISDARLTAGLKSAVNAQTASAVRSQEGSRPPPVVSVKNKGRRRLKALIAGILLVLLILVVLPAGLQAIFVYVQTHLQYGYEIEYGIVSQAQGIGLLLGIGFALLIMWTMTYLFLTIHKNLTATGLE